MQVDARRIQDLYLDGRKEEAAWLSPADVRNAGAIFVGALTPEVFGDYVAGPSHVLPTTGAARLSSVSRSNSPPRPRRAFSRSPRRSGAGWISSAFAS